MAAAPGMVGDSSTGDFRHSVLVCYHSDPVVPSLPPMDAASPLK